MGRRVFWNETDVLQWGLRARTQLHFGSAHASFKLTLPAQSWGGHAEYDGEATCLFPWQVVNNQVSLRRLGLVTRRLMQLADPVQ